MSVNYGLLTNSIEVRVTAPRTILNQKLEDCIALVALKLQDLAHVIVLNNRTIARVSLCHSIMLGMRQV